MRVAVLSGGRSSEHDVSLRSGEAVANGLEAGGHEALRVTISRDGAWACDGEPVPLAPAATAILAFALAGELVERHLFFRTVSSSRMPGAALP